MSNNISKKQRYGSSYIWLWNGVLHREDGPAIEYDDGDNTWFQYGVLHRQNGPAVDHTDIKIWYLQGKRLDCKTQKEFERLIRLKAFW